MNLTATWLKQTPADRQNLLAFLNVIYTKRYAFGKIDKIKMLRAYTGRTSGLLFIKNLIENLDNGHPLSLAWDRALAPTNHVTVDVIREF